MLCSRQLDVRVICQTARSDRPAGRCANPGLASLALWLCVGLSALCVLLCAGSALASTRSSGLLAALTGGAEPVQASLHRDQPAAPGTPVWIGLHMRHAPGWHTYWVNPGDSGLPTSFAWELPRGWGEPVPVWPVPERIAVGPLMNFGYEGDLWVPLRLQLPATASPGTQALKVKVNWLMCSDVCIPGGADLALDLVIASAAPAARSSEPVLAGLKEAFQGIPRTVLWARSEVQDDKLRLHLSGPIGEARLTSAKVAYFPAQAGWMVNAAAQELQQDAQGAVSLVLAREAGFADAVDPSGYLRIGDAFFMLRPQTAAAGSTGDAPSLAGDLPQSALSQEVAAQALRLASAAHPGLWILVLMGLAGGLILNLMPCVFPVISLKLLSLVPRPSPPSAPTLETSVRRAALLYAAGVLWSFWLLGLFVVLLQSAGQTVGWGFQLQQPGFVLAMFLLFLLIGANLIGLFEVGIGLTRWASGAQFGAFGSGVLAVIVATPCTAPFMGAALGLSLGQGPVEAMAVFTALAVGMTSPYLILVLRPGLIRRMPRPGAWMDWMRKALAFPMFLAAVWLAWVFVLQTSVQSVLWLGMAAVLLFAACWLLGSRVQPGLMRSEPRTLSLAGSLVLFAAAAGALIAALQTDEALVARHTGTQASGLEAGASSSAQSAQSSQSSQSSQSPQPPLAMPPEAPWAPWSRQSVEAALAAGHIVFVDFTAAWCVSCQANKQLVLQTDRLRELFASSNVRSFRADWTRQDPAITEELRRFGRRGVPMYLVMRQGRDPLLLPEVLTYGLVRDALSSLER